jgi:hypothetical protein
MYEWLDGRMIVWMRGRIDRRMDVWIIEWIEG